MPPQEQIASSAEEQNTNTTILTTPTIPSPAEKPEDLTIATMSPSDFSSFQNVPIILSESRPNSLQNACFVNAAFTSDFPAKKLPSLELTLKTPQPSGEKRDREPVEFDDVLPHMGEFGLYQKILFLLMIPFAFYVAFVYFTQIFITVTPDHYWCRVPELHNLTIEQRKSLSIPKIVKSSGEFTYDRCLMYNVNYEELLAKDVLEADPTWPVAACRSGWEFDHSSIPYDSIAAEFEWVCEKETYPAWAQAVFFGGAIVGGLLFGWLADRYGRIPALVGSNMVGFVAGIATALVGNFWQFCLCRFFFGMAFDNCFTMMYILVLEYVGPKWRTFVANMSIAIFFTMASCMIPWIAYYLADWRMLTIVTSVPLVLAIATPWLVPESARWLVSQGKIEKAITIMKKIEKINGTHISAEMYQDFEDTCHKIQKEEESNKTYSIFDLFKLPRLRNITILLIVIWMIISLVFDGHVRNVGSLGLDLFLTFTIASFAEFPADTFLTLTLDRWGRRWLACGSMVMSGVFSLLAILAPTAVISASLAIAGRFCVNISYNIGLQYAAELLPTVVRAQGVTLIHIMGYVASIIAPFIVLLANVSTVLPLLILGILGIIGGILSLFLPETLDQELPQTLQDGNEFGKAQKMWDFPCCAKNIDEEENVGKFRRKMTSDFGSTRGSFRASFRGEIRSSMINGSRRRSSVRSRKSISQDSKV